MKTRHSHGHSQTIFSGGGNIDILLILSTLLNIQCKVTVTKRFILAALLHPAFFKVF